ncbi:ceramide kinase-like protein [Hoplias malabaricus]|uniref:ceramide kinase-like protein n=1 Tax=Hoplias malabaricus TaxID=27720 RepID=UPI003461CFD3
MSECTRQSEKHPKVDVNNSTKKKKRKKQQKQQHPHQQRVGAESEAEAQRSDSDSPQPLLRGIFQINKTSHDVLLTPTRISWTSIQPEHPTTGPSAMTKSVDGFVELKDVFAVKVKRRRSVGQKSGGTLLGITLFFCKTKGAKLKDHTIHLNNLSTDHCEIWFKQLKDILNVTERKGHALSILKECSLEEYDGVVCVGGDGSVAEVSHGLLLRTQMDAERDPDSFFMPVQAALPLGVIPAGSTDAVACSVHGVRHPVTAALHIIMGHRQVVDMCSVSSVGRLLRFCYSVMFGFGGRTLASAEKLSWIPHSQRRELAFISTLTNLKPEDCELSFIVSSGAGVDQSDSESEKELSDIGEDAPWQTRQGLYLSMSVMSIPCLCSMAPRGLAPFTRLNNSSMALVAVGNTSRSEFIKHLKRYSSMRNQLNSWVNHKYLSSPFSKALECTLHRAPSDSWH